MATLEQIKIDMAKALGRGGSKGGKARLPTSADALIDLAEAGGYDLEDFNQLVHDSNALSEIATAAENAHRSFNEIHQGYGEEDIPPIPPITPDLLIEFIPKLVDTAVSRLKGLE